MIEQITKFANHHKFAIKTAVVGTALMRLTMAQPLAAADLSPQAHIEQVQLQDWEKEALRAAVVVGSAGLILGSVGKTLKMAESSTKMQRSLIYSGLVCSSVSLGTFAIVAETAFR